MVHSKIGSGYIWLLIIILLLGAGTLEIILRIPAEKKDENKVKTSITQEQIGDITISDKWMYKEKKILSGVVLEVFLSGRKEDLTVIEKIEKLKKKVGHNCHEIIYLKEDQNQSPFIKERIKNQKEAQSSVLIDGKIPSLTKIEDDTLWQLWLIREMRKQMILTHYINHEIVGDKIKYSFEGCNFEEKDNFDGSAIILVIENNVNYLGKIINGVFRGLVRQEKYFIQAGTCHAVIDGEIDIPKNCNNPQNIRLLFIEQNKDGEIQTSCCSDKNCVQHKTAADYFREEDITK